MAAKTEKSPEPKIPPARQRDLDAAISSITKAYGEGSIMRLGDARARVKIEVIPTGALAVDLALGVGGVPRGRVVEIFGPESSGKTTLMLHVIANAQKGGGLAAFIDAEHALDPAYAKKLGINLDDLLVSQPDSGEEALTICETLARSNALDVIVVDSVAALVPKAELEGHASALDEPGPAQAHRHPGQIQDHLHFHQSTARKSRRHVRQPGNHSRRQGAQVLRQRPH
jgi:recombination protein RecA